MMVILAIVLVASSKRIAKAQEQMAQTQAEIAKQLASLAIELRNSSKGN